MVRPTLATQVHRSRNGSLIRDEDLLATEEPMEIRLYQQGHERMAGASISVTMRTPGHDFELAAGFLYAEGVVEKAAAIQRISYCTDPGEEQRLNIVNVYLQPGVSLDPTRLTRHFYTTSSCGVCGKASLEAISYRGCQPVPSGTLQVQYQVLQQLPDTLRSSQDLFQRTGGLHAAGLFDQGGNLQLLREDVGRHNAVDKVLGHQLLAGNLPLSQGVLVISGRSSFEIMQKAVAGGLPMVVAVGAPSSLAVELARQFNMTLVGFARPDGFNVYSGAQRITGTG